MDLRLLSRLRTAERGFSLAEMVVAIVIAAAILATVAAGAMSSLRGSLSARRAQTAIDLANARVEQLREVEWIALDAENGVQTTVVVDERSFVVATTVTASSVQYLRDVVVDVAWTENGVADSRKVGTSIAQSTRGLALPDFTVTAVGETSKSLNPGASGAFVFRIANQGAPDSFNVTSAGSISAAGLYTDDGDAILDPPTDAALVDTTSDSLPDVGRLDPSQSVTAIADYLVPADATTATVDLTVTVRSAAQPTAQTAAQTLALQINVVTGVVTPSPTASPSASPTPTPTPTSGPDAVCADPIPVADPADAAGYTKYQWIMHNSGTNANSVALRPLSMDLQGPVVPAEASLPAFSTDLINTPGRVVESGGSFDVSGASKVADFRSPVTAKTYTSGMALRGYVKRPPGGTAATISLAAKTYSYRAAGNKVEGPNVTAAVTLDATACGGWQAFSLSFPLAGASTLGTNYVLAVRVWNTGSESVVLAYDHATYPASFTVVQR